MTRYILIYLAAFIFIGCKKDPNKNLYFGAASAKFNGQSWTASKVRCVSNIPCFKGKLSFEFRVFNQQGFSREKMGFYKIPVSTGTYVIYPGNFNDPLCKDTIPYSSYFTHQDDGDVLLDSYDAIPSLNNYFTIAKYNERTKELWGSFAVTFKIFRRRAPNSPDTISVTNGNFYTKILD